MSAGTVAGVTGGWSIRRALPRAEPWCVPDFRRVLQMSLAALWLFDGVLQLQPFMFTPAFGSQMIAPFAHGNPAAVADGITWCAEQIARHSTLAGVGFAGIQMLIAVGIAWRPTVKAALAVSVVWSLGVWWIGEGMGDLFRGDASPVRGAPGAVLIYALLAVLLWPAPSLAAGGGAGAGVAVGAGGPGDRDAVGAGAGAGGSRTEFVAARPIGATPARIVWLVLWGGFGCLMLAPANRAPRALQTMIAAMASGEPQWLASLDQSAARVLADRGLEVSIALAVLFVLIGVAVFAPAIVVRAALVLASLVAVVIWVVGEGFGGVFSGPATDPNSGPLLVLLAAAYWPVRAASAAVRDGASAGARSGKQA